MCDIRNNVGMTWSNGKSLKLWVRSSQSLNWKKFAIKAIWFKILLGNVITTKGHHKEDSMIGCKITSRCIVFRSPIVSSYAQSNNITYEQKNPITTSIRSWLRAIVSKLKSGLFYLKFGWESNTKKVENILSFLTGIYLPSSDKRFRFYDFLHDDRFAKNCNSGQIAVLKEK
jgi:hypothetical protein